MLKSSLPPAALAITILLITSGANSLQFRAAVSEELDVENSPAVKASPLAEVSAIKKFTAPENDPNFTTFPNGKTFADFKATLVTGVGEPWTDVQQDEYEKLKQMPVDKVQWALLDLDNNKMLSQSKPSKIRIFGASTSKIFVVSALLDRQNGEVRSYPGVQKEVKDKVTKTYRMETFSEDDLDHMARIYMRSNNLSWVLLQSRLGMDEKGELNADRGRARVIEFTERMGYHHARAWQGDLLLDPASLAVSKLENSHHLRKHFNLVADTYVHGNELTAADTAKYLYDTYMAKYPGAEYAWKLLYTCQTGGNKGNKYIPKDIFVGGKTGTYPGGFPAMSEANGVKKNVSVYNHALTFYYNGTQYGLVVLTDLGKAEPAAVLAGGLIKEFVGVKLESVKPINLAPGPAAKPNP